MKKKIIKRFFFIFFFAAILIFFYIKFKTEHVIPDPVIKSEKKLDNSNIIKSIKHVSKDNRGNEYTIEAEEGQINLDDTNIIFLSNVKATIKLKNSNIVTIVSNFGKYNISSNDTNFFDNVVVNYIDNKITGEYLDYLFMDNLVKIYENVVYINKENILKADIAEMNLKTKDTKIYMKSKSKKVNIQNSN